MTGRPASNLLGMKFGRLTVLGRTQNHPTVDRPTWLCLCECGQICLVLGGVLKNGTTKSCGCFRRGRAGDLYKSHGKSKTLAYLMYYDACKRARNLGLPLDLNPDRISIPEVCPVLGLRLTLDGPRDTRPSLDRIVPAKGYVTSNVRVISFRANRIKSDATPEELSRVLAYSLSSV